MANLTKEYFDKQIGGVREEIKRVSTKIDAVDKNLSTKIDTVEKNLSAKIDDLNDRTARGFRDLEDRLDVKKRVEKLERNYEKIKEALHLAA